MTLSEKIKVSGLKDVKWLADQYGCSTRTLNRFYGISPVMIDALIAYAVEMKEKGEWL